MEQYLRVLGERPDVLSLVESMRQARRQLSVAKGALWPEVTVNGGYALTRDPTSQAEWDVMLRVELPLFDGGLILARIREQKSLVQISELHLQQVQRLADQEVRAVYQRFIASVAQLIQLEEATRLSRENFLAQQEDYSRGVVSNLEVLNALRQFHHARRDWHQADMNTRLSLIQLHVAAGQTQRSVAEGP